MKQIRITIPPWLAKTKGWSNKCNLQVIPVLKDSSAKITKETEVVIKEV